MTTALTPNPDDTHQSVGEPGGPLLPENLPTDEEQFDAFMESLGADWTPPGASPPAPPVQSQEDPDNEEEATDDDIPTEQPPVLLSTQPTVRIGDTDVPVEEVRAYYELGKQIRENGLTPPAPAPTVTPEPTPTPVEPPAWIDKDDEVQMGLWEANQALITRIDDLEGTTKATADTFARQVAVQQFTTALTQFRTAYPNLDDTDLALVRPHAAQLLPAIQSVEADPIAAMKRAMYLAALDIEGTRGKVIEAQVRTSQDKSKTRKQKISSLGGTSGSAPRTGTPRLHPRNDREAVDAFAKEISESFQSNGRIN